MQNLFVLLFIIGVVWGFPRQPAGRIVGGHNTDIKDYPYQLAVLNQWYQQFCGASLIASQWALTAAHCASGESIPTAVRAGSSTKSRGGQLVRVYGIAIHPNYDHHKNTPNYDFALLKLIQPINAKYGTPIPLPSANHPARGGEIAVVSGWGSLWNNGRSPENLQVVELPIVSYDVCKKLYRWWLGDATLCAGTFKEWPVTSHCHGDSGGPAVVNGRLAGVTSWALGCSTSVGPAVFADVAHATDWINRYIPETRYLKQNTLRSKDQHQNHNQILVLYQYSSLEMEKI